MKFGSSVPYTETIKKSKRDNQSTALHSSPDVKKTPPPGGFPDVEKSKFPNIII